MNCIFCNKKASNRWSRAFGCSTCKALFKINDSDSIIVIELRHAPWTIYIMSYLDRVDVYMYGQLMVTSSLRWIFPQEVPSFIARLENLRAFS